MCLVINALSFGLLKTSQRLGVTPLVTLWNLLRRHGMEVAQDGLLQKLGVQGRDPVDRVAAHARQMRHAHVSAAVFVDQRQAPEQLIVSRKSLPHIVQEAAVDLVE